MAKDSSARTLLGRLRTAVKKVRLLMNFNLNRLRLASIFIGGGAASSKRQTLSFNDRPRSGQLEGASSSKRWLSFNDRAVGLNVVTDDHIDDVSNDNDSGSSSHGIQRTISFPSSEDDVDKRAEMFIANFYRQLRIERQVSLELSYHRDTSFGSSSISP